MASKDDGVEGCSGHARAGDMAEGILRESAAEWRAEAIGLTDRGCVRRSNQDNFVIRSDLGLFAVCDGMGGVAGGEIASQVATQSVVATFAGETWTGGRESAEAVIAALKRAAAAAHRAVRSRALEEPSLRGMGTTLVAAAIAGSRLTVLNVGDSRAYLVRRSAARQLTADHSWVAEQVREGLMTRSQAERSSFQSLITRAVGIAGELRPDVFGEVLEVNDTILLTSDGLIRHVKDTEIGEMLGRPDRELTVLCRALVERAKRRGGSDNITCVAIRVTAGPAEELGYAGGRSPLDARG